jgi:16S rRNA G966 N2-methylase RsmD
MDVDDFLSDGLAAPGELVYADPPYETGAARNVLSHYTQTRYPAHRRLVIEHRGELEPPGGGMRLDKEKRYGDTVVSFFTPEEATA